MSLIFGRQTLSSVLTKIFGLTASKGILGFDADGDAQIVTGTGLLELSDGVPGLSEVCQYASAEASPQTLSTVDTYFPLDFGAGYVSENFTVTTGASWNAAALVAGRYRIACVAQFAPSVANSTGNWLLTPFKNGLVVKEVTFSGPGANQANFWSIPASFEALVDLEVGDYVNVQAQTSLNNTSRVEGLSLVIERIGPTPA